MKIPVGSPALRLLLEKLAWSSVPRFGAVPCLKKIGRRSCRGKAGAPWYACIDALRVMDGWLKDPRGCWYARFHRDPGAGSLNSGVVVDNVKPMPGDAPALLKTRRSMRYEDSVALWFQLKSYGWTVADAAW